MRNVFVLHACQQYNKSLLQAANAQLMLNTSAGVRQKLQSIHLFMVGKKQLIF